MVVTPAFCLRVVGIFQFSKPLKNHSKILKRCISGCDLQKIVGMNYLSLTIMRKVRNLNLVLNFIGHPPIIIGRSILMGRMKKSYLKKNLLL